MDEQRVQAYLALIQELLECPSGEEPQILSQSSELVDEGFVQVCELVAAQLQEEGQDNQAQFLRDVAQEVGQYLNSQTSAVATGEGPTQGTEQDYLNFLIEVLGAIEQSQGNPQVVYPLLQQNLDKLDLTLAETLQHLASQVFGQVESNQTYGIAGSIFLLSNLIQQFPLGNRADNLEIAIASYQSVLKVFTREVYPEDWAGVQNNLGITYYNRIREDRGQNIEKSILCYQAALDVFTRPAFPLKWAMAQNNLGEAYLFQVKGDRSENIEKAITYYEYALEVCTRHTFSKQWAMIQTNLGNAYFFRIRGKREENIEKSIRYCKAALEVCTQETLPYEWARSQNTLGNSYLFRIRGERANNIELAITALELALKVRKRESFPLDWAMSQNNLGNAYLFRINGNKADNIEQAIFSIEVALELCTNQTLPYEWARGHSSLGNAYLFRIRGERLDNIERSIRASEFALQVYTHESFPEEWATTQNNLGNAYLYRIQGERAENLERAITFMKASLEVYTHEGFPEQWATTQNNLGVAYLSRIRGERAENLERAITFMQTSLEVYTREGFPEQWARTQNNLGETYRNRIRGERAENLEISIAFLEASLQVYTRQAFPYEWARTQNNLGVVYQTRIQGERVENLDRAIAFLEASLQVYTREAFPEDWARTQNNLGSTYQARIRGERAENLERAISYLESSLQVYTREGFPYEWATTQVNLGGTYRNRIRGERAENLDRAIVCSEAALEIYTRTDFPQEHTKTLGILGLAYQAQSHYYSNDPIKKRTALQNAYIVLEQALDTVEYLRGEITSGDEAKRKLNEEWMGLYVLMVEVCLELGKYTAAIEYVDRSKARNLTELIATRDAYPRGDIPPEVRQRLQQLRQAISEEDRCLKQDPNPDYTHISQLREEFQANYPYKPLKFPDIQSLLDDETVILEWYILDEKFLTFTLTNQTLNLWASSEEDRQNLIDWTVAYIDDYDNNSQWRDSLPQRLETLAQILHLDEILQNLRQNFPNCQKLILIPHLFLHLFPLHALPIPVIATDGVRAQCLRPISGPNGHQEGLHIAPLQDIFPKGVTYAPNCQLLQQAQNRQRPHFNQLFAIQNPTEDLDWADVEIENIRTLFPEPETLAWEDATTANLLDEQRREILSQTHHLFFSCHAAFNPNSPLDSGLLLADGILTLENIIANLNLSNCSLVTLSACETGQVAIDTTDEYISLSSGFILAGSPSVLVSLWSVNQVSTALLLIRTYELLQQQPGQLAQSLQAAQKWLRETTVSGFEQWRQQCPLFSEEWREALQPVFAQMGQNKEEGINHRPYQSPYHWAAFCIVGQGEQNNG
ncbi:CHAT domain-containing protein [Oscillatoria acuminata]|uniref:CHAT domain-containing protein n=1 Tax=Oscillatoria acuminata PCC 6304 TaxID=56110 RepID=K9TAN4_9CYAN|nr:CHAT domain-containing tetratricopeptide repeat protein [Oscillatoria acuminata]AFY79937.1 hypothetical protein Oscil6304_0183 [Oscillatoria acuminata PCC 6304]